MGLKIVKKIPSRNYIGIFLCAIACILFWLPYKYEEKYFLFKFLKHLSLLPTLLTGTFSLGFLTCLYIRGIFSIKKDKLSFIAFLINLTLFATLFEIFLSPGQENAQFQSLSVRAVATIAFMTAIILFGGKEFSKIICLLLLLSILFFRLKLVSNAMGFWGYLAFLCMVSGIYLQESINLKALKNEAEYLVGRQQTLKHN